MKLADRCRRELGGAAGAFLDCFNCLGQQPLGVGHGQPRYEVALYPTIACSAGWSARRLCAQDFDHLPRRLRKLTAGTFEPYGRPRATGPNNPNAPPLGWLGQYQDPTGLTHLGACQYDPTAGMFLSTDSAASTSFSGAYT